MFKVIYLHGFLSSPQSYKAVVAGQWLAEHHPDIEFHCPTLTPYPAQTRAQLDQLVADSSDRKIGLLGSSMGGFWASYLAETHNLPAVLINPACEPLALMPTYLNQTLANYHTDDTYFLNDAHLEELAQVPAHTIQRPANYRILVQTGDETLDFRKAVSKYRGATVIVEEGGDHSFQDFVQHLPDCLTFIEQFYAQQC